MATPGPPVWVLADNHGIDHLLATPDGLRRWFLHPDPDTRRSGDIPFPLPNLQRDHLPPPDEASLRHDHGYWSVSEDIYSHPDDVLAAPQS